MMPMASGSMFHTTSKLQSEAMSDSEKRTEHNHKRNESRGKTTDHKNDWMKNIRKMCEECSSPGSNIKHKAVFNVDKQKQN
jgi:hypothetical protein